MSIAILPISQQFQWTSTTIGLVQSSFFWGYLLTQVGSPGVLLASSTCCLCQSASLQQPTGSFDAQLPPDQCTLRGSSAWKQCMHARCSTCGRLGLITGLPLFLSCRWRAACGPTALAASACWVLAW